MSALRQLLEDYLVTRRAFGYRLERAGRLLGQFVDYCDERGCRATHSVTSNTR